MIMDGLTLLDAGLDDGTAALGIRGSVIIYRDERRGRRYGPICGHWRQRTTSQRICAIKAEPGPQTARMRRATAVD